MDESGRAVQSWKEDWVWSCDFAQPLNAQNKWEVPVRHCVALSIFRRRAVIIEANHGAAGKGVPFVDIGTIRAARDRRSVKISASVTNRFVIYCLLFHARPCSMWGGASIGGHMGKLALRLGCCVFRKSLFASPTLS
jgi:hypothetical protein